MKSRPEHPPKPVPRPFSRPLKVDEVDVDALDLTIEANAAERVAVARELGLPSIGNLDATFRVTRRPDGLVGVSGVVRADIVQICVVSLEPFETGIEQIVEISFASPRQLPTHNERPVRDGPAHSRRRRPEKLADTVPPAPPADVDEDDPPDLIVGGCIDLGAVAVEFLALGLDFYPKRPGVHFDQTTIGKVDDPPSAFAALGRLKASS